MIGGEGVPIVQAEILHGWVDRKAEQALSRCKKRSFVVFVQGGPRYYVAVAGAHTRVEKFAYRHRRAPRSDRDLAIWVVQAVDVPLDSVRPERGCHGEIGLGGVARKGQSG